MTRELRRVHALYFATPLLKVPAWFDFQIFWLESPFSKVSRGIAKVSLVLMRDVSRRGHDKYPAKSK